MKKVIKSLLIAAVFLASAINVQGQVAKNKQTFAQASTNKAQLELVVNKAMADVIAKNHDTYYKDFLTLNKETNVQGEIFLTISAKAPEYERIVKRILIASEVKEIVFADKKASLEEFFGF